MKLVYVAWQDPHTRSWYTVGELRQEDDFYKFRYTQGALQSPGFVPFAPLRDRYQEYRSKQLFPLFSNRLLNPSRPEYADYLRWMNLAEDDSSNPLLLLARSGGTRRTDVLEVFGVPEADAQGRYALHFFNRGLRYMQPEASIAVAHLQTDERLRLVPEPENAYDSLAMALYSQTGIKVGFSPRYFLQDLHRLQAAQVPLKITVEQVNLDAPVHFRLLCRLEFNLPTGFSLFSGEDFIPLSK